MVASKAAWMVVAGLTAAAPAGAELIEASGVFQTRDQSLWGSGGAAQLDASRFIGTSWNESTRRTVDVSAFTDAFCAGVVVFGACVGETVSAGVDPTPFIEASTRGRVGYEMGVRFDSGSVNADIPFTAMYQHDAESLRAGDTLTLLIDASASTSSFRSNFPDLELYLDQIFEMDASVAVGVDVRTSGRADGNDRTFRQFLLNEQIENRDEIVSFNRDGSGEVRVLPEFPRITGLVEVPEGFTFGEEIDIRSDLGVDLGGITIELPRIDLVSTGGGPVSGESGLVRAAIDFDGVLTTAGLLPPLEVTLGQTFSAQVGGQDFLWASAEAGYNLLDVEFGPEFRLSQTLDLEHILTTAVLFDRGVRILDELGNVVETNLVTGLAELAELNLIYDGQPLGVTVIHDVTAMLSNVTDLLANGFLDTQMLSAFLGVGIGVDFRALDSRFDLRASVARSLSVGPLYDPAPITFLDTSLGTLFGDSFSLLGFNSVQHRFTIAGAPAAEVPEPGSLVLLGAGLVSLLGLRRRCGARRGRRGCASVTGDCRLRSTPWRYRLTPAASRRGSSRSSPCWPRG